MGDGDECVEHRKRLANHDVWIADHDAKIGRQWQEQWALNKRSETRMCKMEEAQTAVVEATNRIVNTLERNKGKADILRYITGAGITIFCGVVLWAMTK